MSVQPGDITIAITVFDRREFILQAIESVLQQPGAVRVIVVEDCGPDPTLKDFVLERFPRGVAYHRNSRRRGLFDNWNACLDLCTTPWLSILHDDDILLPEWLPAMLRLLEQAPGRGIYFGGNAQIDEGGRITLPPRSEAATDWEPIDLEAFAWNCCHYFPGNLFSVATLRTLGGFQKGSRFAGDWNAWFRLAAEAGGAFTRQPVACSRAIEDTRRGSVRVERSGFDQASTIVQRKRAFARLRRLGRCHDVTVRQMRAEARPRLGVILRHATSFAPRMLGYNLALMRMIRGVSGRYRLWCMAARFISPGMARTISRIWEKAACQKPRAPGDYALREPAPPGGQRAR